MIFTSYFATVACATQHESSYIMPINLTENQKTKFLQNFNQGATVYTISCASCHNKKVNNQTIEPEFTEKQLELYKVRIQNNDHSMKLSIRDISDEELQKVMFYLRYKRPKQKSSI